MRIVVDGGARLARDTDRAIAEINAAADSARRRFITAIAGQEMIYLRKEDEARRYLALDPEPTDLAGFPMIEAEVGITAPTAYQIAQIWLFMSNQWILAAAQIEAARLSGIEAARVATSPPQIEAITAQTKTILLSVQP